METDIKPALTVFDVGIVSELTEKKPVRVTKKIPELPALPENKRQDENMQPPETMFGEGTKPGETEPPTEKTAKGTDSTEQGDVLQENPANGAYSTEKGEALQENSEVLPVFPKSHLFDNEIIEKYAKKGIPGGEGKDLKFDTQDFHHRGYMKMLKERIESIWKYPRKAARSGISGDLFIRFSIMRDGSIGDVKLIRTSGYSELDEAALRAVRDGEPYWPLPDTWEGEELSITGHFIYLTGRSYIL